MNRDIDYQVSVMLAFKDGKKIEWYDDVEEVWKDTSKPCWNWDEYDYRVKEEPKYVPYENTEELIEDFCKRSGARRSPMGEPFIWVKSTDVKRLIITYAYNKVYAQFTDRVECWDMKELFENFTFLDGSPCGKKVEE